MTRLIDAEKVGAWYRGAFREFGPDEVRFSINDIEGNLANIPTEQRFLEDFLREMWVKLQHWLEDKLTGYTSEEDREFDEFIDRLVAVRYGKAPKFDGGWIPCEYKEPPRSGSYLTTTRRGAVRVNHYYDSSGWGYSGDAVAWRPLPAAWNRRAGDE